MKEDDITWVVINLGNLYFNQGKIDEAEKIYKHVLQGKEKA